MKISVSSASSGKCDLSLSEKVDGILNFSNGPMIVDDGGTLSKTMLTSSKSLSQIGQSLVNGVDCLGGGGGGGGG